MHNGFILLHRKLINWEWYDDINVKVLFLHLLLKANHKPKKWKGTLIPKGSFITGRYKLAIETGLTEQQIRTSINKLKSTNEITIKTTNLNSLISITNWGSYQANNQQSNQRITNEQPTDNQQITTTNNENKENNVKNEYIYNQFYDSELKTTQSEYYKKFVGFIFGNNDIQQKLKGVLSIENQLKFIEFEKLLNKFSENGTTLRSALLGIENDKKYYKGKKSLYLTLNNWAKNNFKK